MSPPAMRAHRRRNIGSRAERRTKVSMKKLDGIINHREAVNIGSIANKWQCF